MGKALRCKIGIHKWVYTRNNKFYEEVPDIMIQEEKAQRVCELCGEIQEQEIHCLGMNPPSYTSTWLEVVRNHQPRITKDGLTKILINDSGELFVLDRYDECYSLVPGPRLGPREDQGKYTSLGEFIIGGNY